jgi:FkbM family methyltransferase
VLHRYLSPHHSGYPFDIHLRNGIQITAENFHDLVTAWVVNFRKEYKMSSCAETVVDIGANVGFFSLYAAFRNHDARIIAVEPFPTTFAQLHSNVARNRVACRVDCWNVGIAECPGIRVMSGAVPSQYRGILPAASPCDGEGHAKVHVVTFEELIQNACSHFQSETIDFVKVDIEGGEHEALKASSPRSFFPIKELGMEYHPNQPKRQLFNHLQSAGLLLSHDRVIGPDVGVAHFRRAEASGSGPWCGTGCRSIAK